jgi:signal transduction histidine kinase
VTRAVPAEDRAARRQDLRAFVIVTGVLGGMLALAGTAYAALALGVEPTWLGSPSADPALSWTVRALVDVLTVAATVGGAIALRVVARPPRTWPLWVLALGAGAGAVHGGLQALLGLADASVPAAAWTDGLVTGIVCVVVLLSGLGTVRLVRRARAAERSRNRQAAQAADALAAVQRDELRMRRRIADGLHGTVQNRLVLIGLRLDAVAAELPESQRHEVQDIRRALDQLRQEEVRMLSAALFPEGLELGAVAAIRMILRRVPDVIDVDLRVDERARELEGPRGMALPEEDRLHLVRAAEEALTNALRHGRATRLRVALSATEERIALRFEDNGRGLDPDAPLSGLARLRDRFARAGGALELADAVPRGVVLCAWLPLPSAPASVEG